MKNEKSKSIAVNAALFAATLGAGILLGWGSYLILNPSARSAMANPPAAAPAPKSAAPGSPQQVIASVNPTNKA